MKTVEFGTSRYTRVYATDDPGPGGANHSYLIAEANDSSPTVRAYAHIEFQKGPVKETGPNGIFMEDLLAIVLDRLYGFQSGEYSCRENSLAITKIEEALHWLNHRTAGRVRRGVEGTSTI
jgi:hypothetical protein